MIIIVGGGKRAINFDTVGLNSLHSIPLFENQRLDPVS